MGWDLFTGRSMCSVGDAGVTKACLLEIVVPTFNEGEEVRLSITRTLMALQNSGLEDFRIRVVVDGPDLQTISAVSEIVDGRVHVEVLPVNMGKGFAIRKGLLSTHAEFVAFIDGDLDISPEAIIDGLSILQRENAHQVGCAYGSKFHPMSQVDYPMARRLVSIIFKYAVRLLFGLHVEDTQTGIKVFRSSAIREHLANLSERGFLFDIEILARMSEDGWKCVPVPVRIDYNYTSTINARTMTRLTAQTLLLAIRIRLRRSV